MVDGKGLELSESIEGEPIVRRVRGIGPELSEDDEFQEEQRARLRDENGRRMTMNCVTAILIQIVTILGSSTSCLGTCCWHKLDSTRGSGSNRCHLVRRTGKGDTLELCFCSFLFL